MVQLDRPQITIRRMRTVCWMPNATDTHSEYVILIAFPLQQWFSNAPRCYVIRKFPVLSLVIRDITDHVTRHTTTA